MNLHMQVSEIYVSYVNNTLMNNIVLIHFKPTFLDLLKHDDTKSFLVFSGV